MSYVELMKAGSVRPFADFVGIMFTFNAGMHAYVFLVYPRLKVRAQSDQLRIITLEYCPVRLRSAVYG